MAQQFDVDPPGLRRTRPARGWSERRQPAGGTKKEPGLQAFVRQYQDFMQIVLLVAAVINDRHRRDGTRWCWPA